jgi:quercetin dioxygenase-like cupin family protein
MPKLFFASPRDLPTATPQPGLTEHTLQSGGVVVRSISLAPRTIVETHRHDEERIGIVVRGGLAMVIAGEQRILAEGDSYVVPPATAHGMRVLEQRTQVIEVAKA